MISLTTNPIDVNAVIQSASVGSAGAINVFIGTIRDSANEKKVVQLEYEAYERMAIAEMQKIADQASTRWKLLGYSISHRTGVLKPGDVAVVVAVSTKHRKESFEACQFIIDSLKVSVPIFKKEIFDDGEVWVGAQS